MLFKSRCDMKLPLSTVGLKAHVPCSIESMYTITYSSNFIGNMSNFSYLYWLLFALPLIITMENIKELNSPCSCLKTPNTLSSVNNIQHNFQIKHITYF